MTNSPQETRPGFIVNSPEGLQTEEYKKIATVSAAIDALVRVWPAEEAFGPDFKLALEAAIGSVTQVDSVKLEKLGERLQPIVEAATTPEEERTPEQTQIIQEETKAADVDHSGTVSKLEAMNRVYQIMIDSGLGTAAAIFKKNKIDPLANRTDA